MNPTAAPTPAAPSRRGPAVVAVIVVANVLVLALLVIMGVANEEPPAYTPSPLAPRPANGLLVGPEIVTIDATDPDRWRFFSFDRGSIHPRPGPADWDLAFRRFEVIANGGDGFPGQGGLLDLGERAFDEIATVPQTGYVQSTAGSDTLNAAVRKWYDYSYFSHLLTPKPRIYAVRTADGRYAKLQFVGYYCPGATPGCVTFRYVFQGAGGSDLAASTSPTPNNRPPRNTREPASDI